MPALLIKCYGGEATVLVNSRAAIMRGCLYTDAGHYFQTQDGSFRELTTDEFKACPWTRICSIGLFDSNLSIRISIYGTDLSETARNVSCITAHPANYALHNLGKKHSPRIKWLAKYAEISRKRRIAVVMAGHPRLGGKSGLKTLGDDTLRAIADRV
jgi:hypothetical protein